jgi:hypothetical protein
LYRANLTKEKNKHQEQASEIGTMESQLEEQAAKSHTKQTVYSPKIRRLLSSKPTYSNCSKLSHLEMDEFKSFEHKKYDSTKTLARRKQRLRS